MAGVSENDKKVLNNMKALAIDMITEANSGHPGMVLSAAPLIHTLFSRYLIVNPNDPHWINRDRLVLSAGHGSALLYSAMFMAGYHFTLDDMKRFRKFGAILPGHPEITTPGVDASTGPLGQGIANAVGMAIAEAFLENTFVLKDKKNYQTLFNYYTYVICSDGDLMEGVANEAMSLAGTLGLGKLILLYDANQMTLDGPTSVTYTEDIVKKYEAMNWQVLEIKDSTKVNDIDKAIKKARLELTKPSLIVARGIIGKDSILEGLREAHGTPLTKEAVTALKNKWGMRDVPFAVSKESVEILQKSMIQRNNAAYGDFFKKQAIFKADGHFTGLLAAITENNLTFDISNQEFKFELLPKEAMRDINSKVINTIAPAVPLLMTASADVFSSTKVYLANGGDFGPEHRTGKNIWCGVREHAMAAIMNGIALSGLRVIGSTFLTFSDYMRPAMRMASIMKLPVTYVFTHDSYSVGEDGPTHQPIEQLSSLRTIPNFKVFRPADFNEIVGCWTNILKDNDTPSALVISKLPVTKLQYGNAKGVEHGGYLVRKETNQLSGIIVASGVEVHMAVEIANELAGKGFDLRVISMPCLEIFKSQSPEYRNALIPPDAKTIIIEPGESSSWHFLVSDKKHIISLEHFGECGDYQSLQTKYGYDYASLMTKIIELL